jgi:hypothetical protein
MKLGKKNRWLLFALALAGCNSELTYRLEKLSGPVGLIAVDQSTHTSISFYALNQLQDFTGYDISTGATEDEALNAAASVHCDFTSNWTSGNKPTIIQLGGTQNATSEECYNSFGPLTAGTWISVSATRDCSNNVSQCTTVSEAATAEVLAYVAPPTSENLTQPTDTDYMLLEVTMTSVPADLTGIGLFYNRVQNDAIYKAAIDGSFVDGLCELTAGSVTAGVAVKIQIGGTLQTGMDCHITNFYLSTGDKLVVRNKVSRTKYPWSYYKLVTVP